MIGAFAEIVGYALAQGKGAAVVTLLPFLFAANLIYRFKEFKKNDNAGFIPERVFDVDMILRLFKPEYITLECVFKPHDEMFVLVDELIEKGYKLGIASNIAPKALELLQKRYPKYFEKFDFILHPKQENGWLNKNGQPDEFFEALAQQLGDNKALFIDDKKEHCENAEKQSNITSIRYKKGDVKGLRELLKNKTSM